MASNKAPLQRLEKQYKEKILPELFKEKQYKSVMQVPKIEKIVVNMGVGDAVQDSKKLDDAVHEMMLITGQKPLITKAKKSLAAFKLREGMPIGAKVTLRGKKMYDFLDKLINVAIPRVRDFRGIPTSSFDKQGNYTLGVKEQIIFPEIDYDKVKKVRGMDITIVTTTKEKDDALALLAKFGMPFVKQGDN